MSHRTLDELLAEARGKIERLEPAEAWSAAQDEALIVDTSPIARPASFRDRSTFRSWSSASLRSETSWAGSKPGRQRICRSPRRPPRATGAPGMDSPA
ncbi:MAG TPA: hypothetical protein VIL92_03740 [Gaiellaceae bacterium]